REALLDALDQLHHPDATEDSVDHLGPKFGDPGFKLRRQTTALRQTITEYDCLNTAQDGRRRRRRGVVGSQDVGYRRARAESGEYRPCADLAFAQPVVALANVSGDRCRIVVHRRDAIRRATMEKIC